MELSQFVAFSETVKFSEGWANSQAMTEAASSSANPPQTLSYGAVVSYGVTPLNPGLTIVSLNECFSRARRMAVRATFLPRLCDHSVLEYIFGSGRAWASSAEERSAKVRADSALGLERVDSLMAITCQARRIKESDARQA
jgi:hypothetical protein